VIKAAVSNFHVALGDGTTDYIVLQQGSADFGALLITGRRVGGPDLVGLTLQNVPVLSAPALSSWPQHPAQRGQ